MMVRRGSLVPRLFSKPITTLPRQGAFMKYKLSCIGFLLLTILAGGAGFAGQDHRKTEDAFDKMMREGWKPAAPGVLQRRSGDRRVETYAIGADGLRWAVREMENRLRFLESQY